MDQALLSLNFSATDASFAQPDTSPNVIPTTVVEDIEVASTRGDLSAVIAALEKSHNMSNGRFGSALFLAVENKRSCIVEYLLSQGAPLSVNHIKAATLNGDINALDLFIKYGWNINTPLEWAVPPPLSLVVDNIDLTIWFLAHGADPNAGCVLDLTPLSAAIQYAKFPVIQILFDHGGSTKYGQLLHYAVRRNHADTIEVLRFVLSKGAPVNDVMYQNRPDCYYQQRAFSLGTPLHEAADLGKLDVARILLENCANPLVKDSLGRTPLQRAERNQHHSVAELLRGAMMISTPSLHQVMEGH